MGIQVDHKRRKAEIIERSIELFAREGYKDVTFQKLAGNCGLARTALYKYFRNKRQIFDAAIEEAERRILSQYAQVLRSEASAAMRLQRICTAVITAIYEQRRFMSVIVDFIIAMRRAGHRMGRPVSEHTVAVRRLFHRLAAEAVRRGEFRRSVSPDRVTDILYSIIESHVLRLTVTEGDDLRDALASFNLAIDSFRSTEAQ